MKAGQCEAISTIVNAMKAHINDVNVCKQGCSALCSITLKSRSIIINEFKMKKLLADNQAKAGQCEAISTIVNVIKANINNVGLCELGCRALFNITNNYNSSYSWTEY